MSESRSESPADDEQHKPGLLDRILGRSEGAHRGPAEDEVAEQEERAEEREEQGTEDQPAQDTGAATRREESQEDPGDDDGDRGEDDDGDNAGDGGDDAGDDAEEHGDLETDSEGEPSVGAMPAADDVDQEAIEQDREERLDPENRPDNVEIDNTDRDFDSEKGMFTDTEGYDEAEKKYDDDAF